MDNQVLQQFRDLLQKTDKIGIALGRNPSVDDMGAALSLYLALEQMRKSVSIASASEPTVELSSLVGIDRVRPELSGDQGGDLVVSFPYREGEIEKVSYTIDGGFLNIVVKAGEQGLTFQEQDVRFRRGGGGAPAVLLVVGTPRLADLGNIFNPDTMKDTTVVNIDNKADNQGYGDLVFVAPQASSVSEIAANLLMAMGVDPDVDIAQNLLSGISYATENFQSPRTSSTAFELAAALMRKGAVRAPVQGGYAPQPQVNRQANPQMNRQASQPSRESRPQVRPQPNPQMPPQQQQNEDRVSSFMPETMRAASPASSRANQIRQQLAQQQREMAQRSQQQPAQDQYGEDTQSNGTQDNPPSDWLTPKVYKGSQPVE